ncbi:MAG TPA: DUF3291 domain-containing protein [Chloroflexota bacterium]|jgi:hypothetical protein
MARLAFYTFGILRAPVDDPQVQEFVDRAQGVFDAAASLPGFITMGGDQGSDGRPRFYDPAVHPFAPHTLSVWTDLASVYPFVYRGLHGEALRLRREWFVKAEWPTYAAWWIGDDEEPAWEDAFRRLEHLHDHGPTPYAFTFKVLFDAEGTPAQPPAHAVPRAPQAI